MKCLFISHDGMIDPLGQSQVIPYLARLAADGTEIHILSCEKPDRYERSGAVVHAQLRALGLHWHSIRYHRRPPVLSTLLDLARLRVKAFALHRRLAFDLVHCRSYTASLIGLAMKRRFHTAFIFDMRAFWADERVEGRLWNLGNPVYRAVYRFFKRKERDLLKGADATIALTTRARQEILDWRVPGVQDARIEVIPCCVDLDLFSRATITAAATARARQALGLADHHLVVAYLGSVGTWYLVDEMFRFFKRLSDRTPNARLLFITPGPSAHIISAAAQRGVTLEALRVTQADHNQVPTLLSLARLGLFFIQPSYSRMAMSPTKLGELLGMGIPVISNAGIGDHDSLFAAFRMGHLVPAFDQAEFDVAIDRLPELLALEPKDIRRAAESCFSLEHGVRRYRAIYDSVCAGDAP